MKQNNEWKELDEITETINNTKYVEAKLVKELLKEKKEWEKEFTRKFHHIDVNECGYNSEGEPDNNVIIDEAGFGRFGLESVKDFISELLKSERQKLISDIELLIANEANLARSDGFPTSRLTSLFNKIKKLK